MRRLAPHSAEHIPARLLYNVNAVFLLFTLAVFTTNDKIIATVITFQSCEILPHTIRSDSVMFWCLQTNGTITLNFLDCISASHRYLKQHARTNGAPCIFLTQGCLRSERPPTCTPSSSSSLFSAVTTAAQTQQLLKWTLLKVLICLSSSYSGIHSSIVACFGAPDLQTDPFSHQERGRRPMWRPRSGWQHMCCCHVCFVLLLYLQSFTPLAVNGWVSGWPRC